MDADRHIEIFRPFEETLELTKKILFQPFDIGKWFVIGFCAWLATFFGGATFHRGTDYRQDFHWHSWHVTSTSPFHDMSPWLVVLILFCVPIVLAFVVLLLWLNSRARFMFVDCIVRNRGAVVAPWREYRQEGNAFFLFRIAIFGCALAAALVCGIVLFPLFHMGTQIVFWPVFVFVGLAWFAAIVVVALITQFMVPVMYRQRCGAMQALRAVWAAMTRRPGEFLLFILFLIVIYVASILISCIAGCVTCCIAALPYLGTVILLPVVMVLFAFPLRFIRQFGDEYDVWATVPPLEGTLPPPAAASPPSPSIPPSEPPPIPPVQDAPPPTP